MKLAKVQHLLPVFGSLGRTAHVSTGRSDPPPRSGKSHGCGCRMIRAWKGMDADDMQGLRIFECGDGDSRRLGARDFGCKSQALGGAGLVSGSAGGRMEETE